MTTPSGLGRHDSLIRGLHPRLLIGNPFRIVCSILQACGKTCHSNPTFYWANIFGGRKF